jgi:hypothetical protein
MSVGEMYLTPLHERSIYSPDAGPRPLINIMMPSIAVRKRLRSLDGQ